jgi:hypothetical protein
VTASAYGPRKWSISHKTDICGSDLHRDRLAPWEESHELTGERGTLLITVTPGRHAGDAIGFPLRAPGKDEAPYVSGDTVYYDEPDEIGRRFTVGAAVLHFGAAVVPYFGDDCITMDGEQGARLACSLGAGTAVLVHYDAWDHFTQGRDGISPPSPTPAWTTASTGRSPVYRP